MKTFLQNDERIKDKVKVTVPRRRRQRLLILSVDADVVEEGIRTSLANALTDGGLPASSDVEVVRHYPTRSGMENWIVDVDMEGADFLLERKRVCIDLERYRLVRFVPIIRVIDVRLTVMLVKNVKIVKNVPSVQVSWIKRL